MRRECGVLGRIQRFGLGQVKCQMPRELRVTSDLEPELGD